MNEETDIIKLLKEGKRFALIHFWKGYPVYDDTDRILEGYDTKKEDYQLYSFNSCNEMEDFLAELSVNDGESEGTEEHKIILCQPKNYGEEAKNERELAEDEVNTE